MDLCCTNRRHRLERIMVQLEDKDLGTRVVVNVQSLMMSTSILVERWKEI